MRPLYPALCLAVYLVIIDISLAFSQEAIDAPVRIDMKSYDACGVVSLYVACQIKGSNVELSELGRIADPDGDSLTTFDDLSRAARHCGIHPIGFNLSNKELRAIPCPAIVQIRPQSGENSVDMHFMVLLGVAENGMVSTLDAPRPPYYWYPKSFAAAWTGKALCLVNSEAEASQLIQTLEATRNTWQELSLGVFMLFLSAIVVRVWWPIIGQRTGPSRLDLSSSGKSACLTIALALLCLGCSSSERGLDSAPRLSVEPQDALIGTIPLSQHEVRIPIHNTGSSVLKIESLTTSCTCAVGDITKTISPGGSGMLSVQLRVRTPGPGGARVVLYTNAPDSPHEIPIRWFGEHLPVLIPRSLVASARAGDELRREVSISYAGGDPAFPLEVIDCKCDDRRLVLEKADDRINARYNRVANGQSQMVVAGERNFTLRCEPLRDGTLESECHFTVRQAGITHVLRFPVEVHQASELVCGPRVLTFVSPSTKSLIGMRRQVTITASTSDSKSGSLQIERIPDFLEVSVREDVSVPLQPSTKMFVLEASIVAEIKEATSGSIQICWLGNGGHITIPVNIVIGPD